jgi:hypothetical protein
MELHSAKLHRTALDEVGSSVKSRKQHRSQHKYHVLFEVNNNLKRVPSAGTNIFNKNHHS